MEVRYIDFMMWYCGMRCDERTLALSFYEHARMLRITSPTILVDLSDFPETRRWCDKECDYLWEKGILRETLDERSAAI